MIRKWAAGILYNLGELCFLVADQVSPATDQVWRDRRWKQYLRAQARQDAYTVPDRTRADDD